MGERPTEIIGAIKMSCERTRVTIKRILRLLVMLPVTLAIMPVFLVAMPIIILFDADSCDEFVFDMNEHYFGYIKELAVGK